MNKMRGNAMTSETKSLTLIKEKDYGTPAVHAVNNKTVTLEIDGREVTVPEGTSIMRAAADLGIMVPKLIMPPLMQELANISPLSWALEGFLDIFIRGGGLTEVLPEVLRLLTFALACFVIAVLRLRRSWRSG